MVIELKITNVELVIHVLHWNLFRYYIWNCQISPTRENVYFKLFVCQLGSKEELRLVGHGGMYVWDFGSMYESEGPVDFDQSLYFYGCCNFFEHFNWNSKSGFSVDLYPILIRWRQSKIQNNILRTIFASWNREWLEQWNYLIFMEIEFFVLSMEVF